MKAALNMHKVEADLLEADFVPMQVDDVDAVLAIEQAAYSHPWTRANFLDSLASGYSARVLRSRDGIIGYLLVMMVVDEAHLLNVAVAPQAQGQGWGLKLVYQAFEIARAEKMESILLEVRPSNLRALQMYQQIGFVQIGRRRDYYPAAEGKREDALVMRYKL